MFKTSTKEQKGRKKILFYADIFLLLRRDGLSFNTAFSNDGHKIGAFDQRVTFVAGIGRKYLWAREQTRRC